MKDLLLKTTKSVAMIAVLFGVISLNACKDDEEVPTETPVEDGFYILGDASAYTDYDIKATLSSTRNEVLQEDRAELLEIYVALKAGGTFNIMQVAGTEKTSWGPSADFADVTMGTNDEPQVTFQRGGIETTETGFSVSADGLYHVVIDTEVAKAVVVPVNWTVIGQATPGGWSGGTALGAPTFDMSTMTWSSTGVEMSKGEWKFRYSDGWKVEIDTAYDLGDGKKGIKVNSNYGGAVDALVPGGDNMNTDQSGVYDIAMTWTAGEGHSATLTRTGDLPARDYSAVSVGLIGDGVKGNDWSTDYGASTPAKDGDKYTWAFNGTELVGGNGFKVRTEGTWDDINLGYDAGVVTGPDAGDVADSGSNMSVATDATYDIQFDIDAKAETMSLSFTKK